jgi:1-acyl-sn-glycerol-3-phosphate acyltransferase
MTILRSLLFALLFYPGTAVYVMGVIILSPFGDRTVRAIVHGWSDYHHWLVTNVLGIRMVFDGHVPEGAYLIAVKHEAMVETVEGLRLARTPVVVMKRELTQIPFFGWVTRRYGVIGVDREAGAKALRTMLAEARQAAEQGRPVIIFPEGTRVPHGEQPELRPGFAGLYRALGLPVVPVAHDSGRLWSRGFVKRRGTIRFKVGEVIPSGLKRDEIEARVRAAINALND